MSAATATSEGAAAPAAVETKPAAPAAATPAPTDAKPSDPAPAPLAAYELKAPEGSSIESGFLAQFAKETHAQGIAQDKAQAVLAAAIKIRDAQAAAEREAWLKQSVEHPQWGGAKLDETVRGANAALAKYATPEFIALLKQRGLDVHPAMVEAWAKVHAATQDDQKVVTAPRAPLSRADEARAFMAGMEKV